MNRKLKHSLLFVFIIFIICLSEFCIARWREYSEFKFSGTREAIWIQRDLEINQLKEPVDIVFLGDSTVKNAIDPELFYQLTGVKAMNLGLTGNLVSYGDYAILKKYLKNHRPPKVIVVWHAIDVWPRNLDMQLFAFTNPDFKDTQLALKNALTSVASPTEYLKGPVEYLAQLFRNQLMKIPSYRHRFQIRKETDEYIPVFLDMDRENIIQKVDPDKNLKNQIRSVVNMDFHISSDMAYWFGKLISLANDNHIQIFGAHAPIHEIFMGNDSAKKKIAFINDNVNRFFDKHPDIKKLNTASPVFLNEHASGDKDHVSESGKMYLTRYYANLINAIKDHELGR